LILRVHRGRDGREMGASMCETRRAGAGGSGGMLAYLSRGLGFGISLPPHVAGSDFVKASAMRAGSYSSRAQLTCVNIQTFQKKSSIARRLSASAHIDDITPRSGGPSLPIRRRRAGGSYPSASPGAPDSQQASEAARFHCSAAPVLSPPWLPGVPAERTALGHGGWGGSRGPPRETSGDASGVRAHHLSSSTCAKTGCH